MTLFRTMQHFCQNAFRKSRSVTAGLKAFRQQSVSLTTARRSNSLGKSFRFDTLEDRTVPTIGLGFAAGSAMLATISPTISSSTHLAIRMSRQFFRHG